MGQVGKCYRHDGRAIGVTAHLYDFSEDRCRKFAIEQGLGFDAPPIESWYYPGGTRLVVWWTLATA
jgi:hypothetical protein